MESEFKEIEKENLKEQIVNEEIRKAEVERSIVELNAQVRKHRTTKNLIFTLENKH